MKYLLASLFFITAAHAYKVAIYTDQPDHSKAMEVIQTFRSTYPFNVLDIDYEIVKLDSDDLNCKRDPEIERLTTCDSRKQRRHSRRNDVDAAMIVSNVGGYGGSGGGVPVITKDSPPTMMLHEYLHTLGLCDEYDYKPSESERYCNRDLSAPNAVVIEPRNPYESDARARRRHMGDIPWKDHIQTSVPITNGGASRLMLGTGRVERPAATPNPSASEAQLAAPIGLYRGRTCDNHRRRYAVWHPGGEPTIMDELSYGLGAANERIVREILESRGAAPRPVAARVLAPPEQGETYRSSGKSVGSSKNRKSSSGSKAKSH